jgi:prepilin-type N-terminal cleavage/methylation domain-containing protein
VTTLRRLVNCERGYTLIELVQVTAILAVVLTGLTVVFVQATNAEMQMNERFQAQQNARLAVDRMRREIHCASAITPTGTSSSITVTLPAQCPTAGGSQVNVVYDMQSISTNRYKLRRAGIPIADYVITNTGVFQYTAPQVGKLGTLRVVLPIDPGAGKKHVWRLQADIVLRNTARL